jgi:hypothetical protein
MGQNPMWRTLLVGVTQNLIPLLVGVTQNLIPLLVGVTQSFKVVSYIIVFGTAPVHTYRDY